MDARLGSPAPDRPSPAGTAPVPWWSGWLALLAGPLVLALGVSFGRGLPPARLAAAPQDGSPPSAEKLFEDQFRGWEKPELVVVLSGQVHGYLQPCGCSDPQYGGLTRRYNLLQLLKKKGWDVAAVDIGDLYPKKVEVREQANEKFKTMLRALSVMGYRAFGVGELELKMPLVQGLADAAALNLKNPRPLSLNLQDPDKIYSELNVGQYEVLGDKVRVGLTSMVGTSLAKEVEGPNLKFFPNPSIVPQALAEFARQKVDFTIVVYHGSTKRSPGGKPPVEEELQKCAEFCVTLKQKQPALAAVDLILHPSDFDTPPARPDPIPGVAGTQALFLGHSGKYVTVLGLFRKPGGGLEPKYELISLGPEFGTPESARKGHPVEAVMEEYALAVKNRNFLAAYGALRDDHFTQRQLDQKQKDAKYLGSDACQSCHSDAYAVWETTGHAHAFDTLVKVKNPSHRQFDPECVVCHVTGLKYRTGYFDPPAGASDKQVKKHNEKLLHVGCEVCHGPGSAHAANPDDKTLHPLINPIKLANPQNELKLDFFCQTCHDIDNDVHWTKKEFKKSWAKIAHPTKRDKK